MKTYKVLTGTTPICMSRSKPGVQCGNCRTENEIEVFEIRGAIQLGKRKVEVRFSLCLTCLDMWADFVKGSRVDGNGTRPRDITWYPKKEKA